MYVEQIQFEKNGCGSKEKQPPFDLVLAFGNAAIIADPSWYARLRVAYPGAHILMNSTAGEIMGTEIYYDSLSVTAIRFDNAHIGAHAVLVPDIDTSYMAGKQLAGSIDTEDLQGILLISDGHSVNCEELLAAFTEVLPHALIVGGLAGGKIGFEHTYVGLNEVPLEGRVAAIAFYGDVSISCGSAGGWTAFGPERVITAAEGNTLSRLDGRPALEIYKDYLGEYASDLTANALFFPLSVRNTKTNIVQTRTILTVDEDARSMSFAGSMLQGGRARLMTSTPEHLIKGAEAAALQSMGHSSRLPSLALLISCIGRKMALNQYTEDEIEAVRNVYGDSTVLAGFYSYGEISPAAGCAGFELHNQTMTIMTITEPKDHE
jgi:hypothetical protein